METLNERLVVSLRKYDTERVQLVLPEILDWDDVAYFRLRYGGAKEFKVTEEPSIAEYLREIGTTDNITIEALRKHRLEPISQREDAGSQDWRIYDCIRFETQVGGEIFALASGRWFQIDGDFANEVSDQLKALPASTLDLPDAYEEEDEGEYNTRVSELKTDILVSLDRLCVIYNSRNRVEICDLFSSDGQFVHVKHWKKSATFSHLLRQGEVSAQLFLRDTKFRDLFRQKLGDIRPDFTHLVPDHPPSPQEYEVTYAIIGNTVLGLPIFSQISLKNATDFIKSLGYHVSIASVAKSKTLARPPASVAAADAE